MNNPLSADYRGLRHGVDLFNRGKFFAAHEALEDVWRAAGDDEKKFIQGLVQLAVAFHHYSTGNQRGMQSVMQRALNNLQVKADISSAIRLNPLMESLRTWREALDEGRMLPPLPQIEIQVAEP
jgi:uncharacterized protein